LGWIVFVLSSAHPRAGIVKETPIEDFYQRSENLAREKLLGSRPRRLPRELGGLTDKPNV